MYEVQYISEVKYFYTFDGYEFFGEVMQVAQIYVEIFNNFFMNKILEIIVELIKFSYEKLTVFSIKEVIPHF